MSAYCVSSFLSRYTGAVLLALCPVTAQSDQLLKEAPLPPRTASNAAMGDLPEGRFEALTEKLFPIERTHLGGDIGFKRLSDWERRNSLLHGFDYAFVNAPVIQYGSEGSENYADNEMDLYLQWRVEESAEVTSRLFFWGTYVQTFSDKANGEFSKSQNMLSSTISAGTDPNKHFSSPSALWWEQAYHKSGFTYRTGQLYATSLWGNNRYTADDREGFMNSVLSSNVGLPWSDRPRGLGVMVKQAFSGGYVSAGIQDAKGKQDQIDLDSFFDATYLYTVELGWQPRVNTSTEGRYKLALGYMDSGDDHKGKKGQEAGWGVALSLQRDVTEGIGLFAQIRHSFGDRIAQDIRTSANAGIVFNKPWGWPNDALGVGLLYARPDDKNLRDEYGLEIFWRLQMTHRFDLAPDIQIISPRGRGKNGTSVIPGLRLRYIL